MGGDYKPPDVKDLTGSTLRAVTQYGPAAAAKLGDAMRQQAPLQAQSDFDVYSQFGPQFFGIGEDLTDQQNQRAVARDLATTRGGGRELAQEALSLDRMANPEFYKNREMAGAGFEALLGGQDPNKLTGSETANLERGINRLNQSRGTPASLGDATTTASNAMLFGDKLNQKRAAFGQTLALFPGLQQGSQSGVQAYQVAAGRGATGANASLGQYQAPQQFDANSMYQGAQSGAFQLQGQNQQLMANRRSTLDKFNDTFSSTVGSVCCFIFLEALNGRLPASVRICRDVHYRRSPRTADGYKRMARWLVPVMRKCGLVKKAVNAVMVKPMMRYGEYLVGNTLKFNKLDRAINNLWLRIWKAYGTH